MSAQNCPSTLFLVGFKCEHNIYVPSPKSNFSENALSFNHSAPKHGWRTLRPLAPVTTPMKNQWMDGKARTKLIYRQVSPPCWSSVQPLPSLRSISQSPILEAIEAAHEVTICVMLPPCYRVY